MSKKVFWGGRFDDSWWLDHLEGEFESSMEDDLEILLANSPGDRKRLAQLERARRLIKETDEECLPEDGYFYTDLHDRIMAAVEEASRESEGRTDESRTSRETEKKRNDDAKMSWTAFVWCALARRWSPVQTKRMGRVLG